MAEITEMDETTFEQDTTLDADALDVECLECGTIGRKYNKLSKHLRRLEKKAHERVKILKSELIHAVNEDPMKTTGKAKPNASDIEAYYRLDTSYQEAYAAWIDAEYEADYAEHAYQATTYGRRKDLELLIRLFERSYFTGPAIARNLTEEQKNRTSERISKKLNRTTK